jgi:UDP-2,4-diacetamido-2,4,6-trideoxy-beta-L-altropyranose hydrolase
MRCLSLATALQRSGTHCRFICRDHEGNFTARIRREGFEVFVLTQTGAARPDSQPDTADPVACLAVNWGVDAQETIAALGPDRPDWLIVDHYALEARWHKKLRPYCRKIMVIDDLADRKHDCDLFLDQNLTAGMATRYDHLLPASCPRLLGPKFALLQLSYAELHPQSPPRLGPVRRLLVSFGGRDPHSLTESALTAVLDLGRPDLLVDLVADEESSQWPLLVERVRGLPHFRLHPSMDSLARLMLQADLALGAGGVTSWERCCLGLPALVVTTAENQRAIAEELHRRKLIRYLGHHSDLPARSLQSTLLDVLDENLEDWSLRCLATVDGQGAERVADLLMNDLEWNVRARPAGRTDEAILCGKRDSRTGGKLNHPNFKSDRKKFYECLQNPERERIYLVEACRGLGWGNMRASYRDGHWHLSLDLETNLPMANLVCEILQAGLLGLRASLSGPLRLGKISMKSPSDSVGKRQEGSLGSPKDGMENLSLSVCSDSGSWINPWIALLMAEWSLQGHRCCWVHQAQDAPGGIICFYLGYGRIVGKDLLAKYRNNLVVHESDLPSGKGWSPLTWQILQGKSRIPAVLMEAAEKVDSGPIYRKIWMDFNGGELVDELREKQADATVDLCRKFVEHYPESAQEGVPQEGEEKIFPRRRPEDSQIDPQKSLKEQFNLLRVADPIRYPAFFKEGTQIYKLHVQKKT